jgi:hypothetical protein
MKKWIFTLVLMVAAIPALFAQNVGSRGTLKVRLTDSRPFRVSIDGKFFRRTENTLTIVNVPPGSHTIKVFGLANRYDRRMVPVLMGTVRLAPYSVNNMIVDPVRHAFRLRSRIMDQRGYAIDDRGNGRRDYNDNDRMDDPRSDDGQARSNGRNEDFNDRGGNNANANDWNEDRNNVQNDGNDLRLDFNEGSESGMSDDRMDDANDDRDRNDRDVRDYNDQRADNNYNENGYNEPAQPAGKMDDDLLSNYAAQMLTQDQLSDLQLRVKNKVTDSERLKLLKSALEHKTYNTAQVKMMMRWLNFDSSRLDFAKWAANSTIDKKNYWTLESEFSFDASKDDFSAFVQASNY